MNDMSIMPPYDQLILPLAALDIAPENPRSDESVDAEEVRLLADNIEAHGLTTPLIAYVGEGCYMVVAGGRRLRALRLLEQEGREAPGEIRVDAYAYEQAVVLGAAEQLSHVRMSPVDELRVFARPEYANYTHVALGKLVGRSAKYVAQRRGILDLPDAITETLFAGGITVDQAAGLTYFVEDPERLTEFFERAVQNKRLDGDELRRHFLASVREWDRHPASGMVTEQEYLDAGGRFQDDLFADAKMILTPGVLEALARDRLPEIIAHNHPGYGAVVELPEDGNIYTLPVHRGIVSATEAEQQELIETPSWRVDPSDAEAVARRDYLEAACEAMYPPELTALLNVGWRYSDRHERCYQSREDLLPDDLEPLYEAGFLDRPEPGPEHGDDALEPAPDEGVSGALKLRIARLRNHALRMELAKDPNQVIQMYLVYSQGFDRDRFQTFDCHEARPDDFLTVEHSTQWLSMLELAELDEAALTALKPQDQRRLLAYKMLCTLTLRADASALSSKVIRAYWTPCAAFLKGYSKTDLLAMLEADPDSPFDGGTANMKKSALVDMVAEIPSRVGDWLPVGF